MLPSNRKKEAPMAERYENDAPRRRPSDATREQRTQRIDRVHQNGSSRPMTEEELRARRRRIAERKRRKKREKRINAICAIIAVIAFSAAICTGVFFFKERNAYNSVQEQKAAADQQAVDLGLKYEKTKEEISNLEKEIADLQSKLPQE